MSVLTRPLTRNPHSRTAKPGRSRSIHIITFVLSLYALLYAAVTLTVALARVLGLL